MCKCIAVDMDEVIADSNIRYFEWDERDFDAPFPLDRLYGKKPRNVVPDLPLGTSQKLSSSAGFFQEITSYGR